MKNIEKLYTPAAIIVAAVILGVAGYDAVGLWAPKPEATVTISEKQLFSLENDRGVPTSEYKQVVSELISCEAKLPPTHTPKATPVCSCGYTLANGSMYLSGGGCCH